MIDSRAMTDFKLVIRLYLNLCGETDQLARILLKPVDWLSEPDIDHTKEADDISMSVLKIMGVSVVERLKSLGVQYANNLEKSIAWSERNGTAAFKTLFDDVISGVDLLNDEVQKRS